MGMISNKKDGGQCWDHWYQTRKANLLKITGALPLDLCAQELTLTSCCRYAESLLANPRIRRYLDKHHAPELRLLLVLLAQHNEICRR